MCVTELTRMGQYGGALAIVALLGIVQVEGGVADYQYMNCYDDKASDRDLQGPLVTYSQFKIDECAGQCKLSGYPYFGIQAQKTCMCGNSYGKHGVSGKCNYTCSTNVKCGGVTSNDVYYTLKTDATSRSTRQNRLYSAGKTFDNARKSCVAGNGDLLSVTSTADLTIVQSILSVKGITSGKIWQGIVKLQSTYAWVNPTTPAAPSTTSSFWVAGEKHDSACVILDVSTGKWSTAQCASQYPFICHQDPPVDAASTANNSAAGDSATTAAPNFDASQLSLYIVLPVFGLCYGGSCVLYCSHKIYKSFKRKKRQKMLLSRLEDMPDNPPTEYEPHNKPKYEPQRPIGRPFSGNKRATVYPIMAPPPMQNGYFTNSQPSKEDRHSKTPVEDIRIPSPRNESDGEEPKKADDDRPETTRDVEISMTDPEPERESTPISTPPPVVVSASAIGTAAVAVDAMRGPQRGSQSAKTKAEVRREKLLKKALKEARDRRRQEGTPLPGDMPPEKPQPPPPNENQWAQPTNQSPPNKYDDEPDSGDSTVNLLGDNERGRSADMGRDPTTMSIQEILRMKVSMRQNKRRPKKILSA